MSVGGSASSSLRSAPRGDVSFGAAAEAPAVPYLILNAISGATLVVPIGASLLTAGFERVGDDLVLIGKEGGPIVLIRAFFSVAVPPTLSTENGAVIDGALALRLAGVRAPGQYAGTENPAEAQPIGRVADVSGEATATRVDGTKVVLTKDAPVFQGDIIETADGAALEVVFIDESTFSVGESGRLVLDEMVFDPTTLEGESSISVLQGVFVFVSGEIAANNPEQMAIKTPVATIGIRGTAVAVQAAQEGESNKVTLLSEQAQDGQTTVGAVIVANEAGTVVLDQAFQTTQVASAFAAPADSYIAPASEINAMMAQLGEIAPQAVQHLSAGSSNGQDQASGTESQTGADANASDGAQSGDSADAAGDGPSDGAAAADGAPASPDAAVEAAPEATFADAPGGVAGTGLGGMADVSFSGSAVAGVGPASNPFSAEGPAAAPTSAPTGFGAAAQTMPAPTAPPVAAPPPAAGPSGGSTNQDLPPSPPPPETSVGDEDEGGSQINPPTFSGVVKLADSVTTNSQVVTTSQGTGPSSGYLVVSFTFSDSGTFPVAFGIMDESDTGASSALFLDNIRINGVPIEDFESALAAPFSFPFGGTFVFDSTSIGFSGTEGATQLILLATGAMDNGIESLLGLAPGTLDAIANDDDPINGAEDATDGNILLASLTVQAGDVLTFDFNFVDFENDDQGGPFNDFAFFSPGANGTGTITTIAGGLYTLGTIGADTLTGSDLGDRLDGLGGDDTILAGLDADILTGGPGVDRFVFNGVDDGGAAIDGDIGLTTGDQITDFASGIDKLVFDPAAFGFAGPGGVTLGSTFFVVADFDGADPVGAVGPYFVYDPNDQTLYHDLSDLNSASSYTVVATVQGGGTIVAGDIELSAA